MVRLKVLSYMEGNDLTKVISIPYGSIKSPATPKNAEIFAISIPYGSIKSRCLDASYTIDVQIDN